MLSDEDRRKLYEATRCDLSSLHDIEIADAAYALGVERARLVKPLVWEPSESSGWHAFTYCIISDGDGGWTAYKTDEPQFGRCAHNSRLLKAACQAHHTAFVLSLLEDA